MNELTELRNNLHKAELEYRKSFCSLDGGSLDLIVKKEELKIARYEYTIACRNYVEQTIFNEDSVNVHELSDV